MRKAKLSITGVFDKTVEECAVNMEKCPWENPEFYACWLAQTYFLVRHTTRFLCLAAARTPIEDRELHYSFIQHLKEESHHDKPLLADLKFLGRMPEDFPELVPTRLIVHNQYHWLQNGGAYSLMGYALFLEGLSVTFIPGVLERMEKAGLSKATTFWKLHLNSDETHYPDGLKFLESLDPSACTDALKNLEESAHLYTSMHEAIRQEAAVSSTTTLPAKISGAKAA